MSHGEWIDGIGERGAYFRTSTKKLYIPSPPTDRPSETELISINIRIAVFNAFLQLRHMNMES
jgi:hypothetical protein